MSFAKYAQFYKENGFFAGSKIKVTVTDSSFIGQELVLTKGSSVIRSTTIPASGKVDFFTDESGVLTLSSNNGTSIISGTVNVTNYATYNVTLEGASTDKSRQMYASKNSVTLDATHSSDTVKISYTGDKSNLSVTSSNPNVATATIRNEVVTITDAGKGLMGTSTVTVTVGATQKYNAKSINISVEKTNGQIDKSWIGLKNIVESGLEEEMCEVGEEYTVALSNGVTMAYIIAAINHDYDHQLIFTPKRSDYLDNLKFNDSGYNQWKNSTLRTYLNSTFMNMMPSDLVGVISEKDMQYAISETTLEQTYDKIWIPREVEVMNTTNYTFEKERQIPRIGRFDAFTDKLISMPHDTGNTWLISPYTSLSQGSLYGNVTARSNSTSVDTSYGVSYTTKTNVARLFPCFHIIKET